MCKIKQRTYQGFLKCIIFVAFFACNDITSPASDVSSFSNWSLNGRVVNRVRVPITGAKITLEAEGEKYLSYTDDQGFFSFELEAQSVPLELSLSSEKLGWAATKIQQYWLEGRQSLTVLQERVAQKNSSLEAPKISLSGVQAYEAADHDLSLSLHAQASSSQKITWLRLGLANGEIFAQKQVDHFNYLLSSDQLSAHNVLYSEALDNNNNRTRLYLPLKKTLLNSNTVNAPATTQETLLSINTQVRASSSSQAAEDSQYSPYVFLSVPKIDQALKGILVRRWDSRGHLSEFHSSQTSLNNFVFLDRSILLREGDSYQYRVAYDGSKSSAFGPPVTVRLLPRYHLTLLEPADETIINSGSNILFRWEYELDEQSLPSGVSRYESFLVYRSDSLKKVVEQPTFKKDLGSKTNSLSLAISYFQPSVNYIWTVGSLLNLSYSSSSAGEYWKVSANSSPSLLQNISTSGFFNLARELNP